VSARERDARGRPLNARPRDGLGRPLPRGSIGVPRVPEGIMLDPDATLTEAQRLLDDGLPFHAHEVLEARWKSAPPGERDLWQGLAQLAVGLTQLLRGNTAGGRALLRRGAERIAPYHEQRLYDIDVTGLLAWADAAGTAPPHPSAPSLRRR
jgi:hypothetical protein